MHDAVKIAICGKGGVGKTSVSALMIRLLAAGRRLKILAIDADPAVGLATSLGIDVKKTVDDIRRSLVKDLKRGESPTGREMLDLLDYEVFSAMEERDGFALLAIGRPEDEGCFCRVNNLLKDIIADLAGRFDVVIIDGEAGIEQINRRVMKTVDSLVLVSDTSAKGIGVAHAIAHVARDNGAVDFKRLGLVLNRVRDEDEVEYIRTRTSLPLLGWITEDNAIRECDLRGKPLTGVPDTSPALAAITGILEEIGMDVDRTVESLP